MPKYRDLTVKVEAKYQLTSWFHATIFVFINQLEVFGDKNNINTLHQELYFIQNQKPTLPALTLQTYGLVPLTSRRGDL